MALLFTLGRPARKDIQGAEAHQQGSRAGSSSRKGFYSYTRAAGRGRRCRRRAIREQTDPFSHDVTLLNGQRGWSAGQHSAGHWMRLARISFE